MVSQRDTRQVERIGTLEIIEEDREICSIIENGWEEIEFAVGSGASETVVGPDMIESAETKEGSASKRNICYEVANGVRIANLGEKRFQAVSDEGLKVGIKAQVCDVNKGLLSVRRLVEKGNRVVFAAKEAGGSYIQEAATGRKMHLAERRGMYMLKLWTKVESDTGF